MAVVVFEKNGVVDASIVKHVDITKFFGTKRVKIIVDEELDKITVLFGRKKILEIDGENMTYIIDKKRITHRHVWVHSERGFYCKICGISKQKYDDFMRKLEDGGE